MPDISMCQNEECPMKKECYRHEAKPNEEYQAYSDFIPIWEYGVLVCDNFLTIKED